MPICLNSSLPTLGRGAAEKLSPLEDSVLPQARYPGTLSELKVLGTSVHGC